MKIVLTLLVGLVPVAAQAAVYKCGEGGQVVFTDRPCVYAPPADKIGRASCRERVSRCV